MWAQLNQKGPGQDEVDGPRTGPWGRGSRSREGWYVMPGEFEHDGLRCFSPMKGRELERIKTELEFNDKDVISAGFPKTGSTWVNEILFLLVNNVDLEKSARTDPRLKVTFLEFNPPGCDSQVDRVKALPSPRIIKTHLPVRYFERNIAKLRKGPKIVVPMRNPKDTLVSLYHFYRFNPALGLFDGDWAEFFELYRNKRIVYEDMLDHTAAWWALNGHPNVHFVKYEDLHKNPAAEIRKIADFLERPVSEQQIESIVKATTLENMRNNPFYDSKDGQDKDEVRRRFFRKGVVGSWREQFTDGQSAYVDNLYRDRLAPVGLVFEC